MSCSGTKFEITEDAEEKNADEKNAEFAKKLIR